jgi:hypothetical protein
MDRASIPADDRGHTAVIDTHGILAGFFTNSQCETVLVRPDRYIAGSFSHAQENMFASAFSAVLGMDGDGKESMQSSAQLAPSL